MNIGLSKVEHLFELIKEIAFLTQATLPNFTKDCKFHMHNSCKGDWDEIWVLSEELDEKIKRPFIRVSLSGFSDTERMQLAMLVSHHNTNRWPIKEILKKNVFACKNKLYELRTPMVAMREN